MTGHYFRNVESRLMLLDEVSSPVLLSRAARLGRAVRREGRISMRLDCSGYSHSLPLAIVTQVGWSMR